MSYQFAVERSDRAPMRRRRLAPGRCRSTESPPGAGPLPEHRIAAPLPRPLSALERTPICKSDNPTDLCASLFFLCFFFIREIVNLCEHSKKSWNIGDNGMTNIVVGMILQSKF